MGTGRDGTEKIAESYILISREREKREGGREEGRERERESDPSIGF